MPLPALVTPDELEEWLGVQFSADELPRAAAFCAAASTRVRAYTHATYVDEEGDLDSDIDEQVTLAAKLLAARTWQNPTGANNRSVGPFSEEYAEALGVMVLSEAETDLLSSTAGSSLGLFTIGTTRGPLETQYVCRSDYGSGVADGTQFLPTNNPDGSSGDVIPFVGPDGY